jgi:hypothetical protein
MKWASTHQCTIHEILFWDFMHGMKLSPRGQFSWSGVFFLMLFFFLVLIIFVVLLFCPAILEPNVLHGTPTYPSNLPSSLPPPNPSASLPFVLTSTTELLAITSSSVRFVPLQEVFRRRALELSNNCLGT